MAHRPTTHSRGYSPGRLDSIGCPSFAAQRADKTAQLNAALRRCTLNWVLVSDADAQLGPATLHRLLRAVQLDSRVGVVGARVPLTSRAHGLDRLHWKLSNRLLQWAHDRGCASPVTAPC